MGYSDVSLRRKHLWLFRGEAIDAAAVRAVAASAVARGDASEAAVDLRSPGPEPERERSDGPRRVTAILHLYELLPDRADAVRAQCAELGGEAYEMLERVVFDRRRPEDADGGSGWHLIGTQTRQPRFDRREFVRRWGAGHAELVRAHHPGVARYAQNYTSSCAPEARAFDGFFEAHFPSLEDWTVRLYDSPEGERLLSEDAASFLDETETEWIWVEQERFGPDWKDFEAR